MSLEKAALWYQKNFELNVIPLIGKKPASSWEKWHTNKQTPDDIKRMNWNTDTTGLGGISGVNDIRVLDFDKIKDPEQVNKFFVALGLPEKYKWIAKSGSGEGLHCWIKVTGDDKLLKFLGGEKSNYKIKLKNDFADHLELRWKDCQTALPPSMHPSKNKYEFENGRPDEMPLEIRAVTIIKVFEEFTVEPDKTVSSLGKMKKGTEFIDKKRVDSAITYLGQTCPIKNYEDWLKSGFALASIGEAGREHFVKMSLINPNYSDSEKEINRKFDLLLKDYNGEIKLGTLYAIAENHGWEKPKVKFWKVNDEQVAIVRRLFIQFLEDSGFHKMGLESGYDFIRIEKNVVKRIEVHHIKDYVRTYIRAIPEVELDGISRGEILDAVLKSSNVNLGQGALEWLVPTEIEFAEDTREKAYVFFRNGYVEVTKDDIKQFDYKKLEGKIWEKQIINRDFKPTDKECEFEIFLLKVCKHEGNRYKALLTAIGYLLHRWKDSSNSKAIILIDEKLSEGAFGRSGKSLVVKAVGKLRKLLSVDGRNFKFDKNFAFQSVSFDTSIIEFNDVDRRFKFEKLFSIITDGITVEKKNKDEISIPFHKSPKIVISTNYTVDGIDDSTLDRQFVIEFSDHYNMDHKPIDEFGHLFFDEWDEKEWNSFDNFMLRCLQLYLNEGLVTYEHKNLKLKKLIDSTSVEFADFAESLEIGVDYQKKELHSEFKEEFPDFEGQKQNTFTRWIKIYAGIEGLEVEEWRDEAKQYHFRLKKK